MNMGSYNYLGFAQNSGKCADAAEQAVNQCGIAVCSSRHELGMLVSYSGILQNILLECQPSAQSKGDRFKMPNPLRTPSLDFLDINFYPTLCQSCRYQLLLQLLLAVNYYGSCIPQRR